LRWDPTALQRSAVAAGAKYQTDPGVVVGNYGFQRKEWQMPNAALKRMMPTADAPAFLRAAMTKHLDLERLADDNQSYLLKVAGVEV
jgi:hypothetical protein